MTTPQTSPGNSDQYVETPRSNTIGAFALGLSALTAIFAISFFALSYPFDGDGILPADFALSFLMPLALIVGVADLTAIGFSIAALARKQGRILGWGTILLSVATVVLVMMGITEVMNSSVQPCACG